MTLTFKKIATLGALAMISSAAFSEGTVTVEKVQGSKAIVKFEGTSPKAGETYDLGGGGGGGGAGTRKMYLGVDTDFISKTFGEGGPLAINLSGTPGWNFGMFEVGIPLQLGWAKSTVGEVSGTVLALGGGISPELNFSDNNPGTMMILFVGADLIFNMEKTSTSVEGVDAVTEKTLNMAGKFGVKYFLNDQVSLIAALAFELNKTLGEGGTTTKALTVPVGIRAYF